MVYVKHPILKSDENQGFKQKLKENNVEQQIAENIIHRRRKLGLTQKQLADLLHTQQSVVSRIEAGNHNLTIANLKGIAQVLDTDISWLVARQTKLMNKRYRLIKS